MKHRRSVARLTILVHAYGQGAGSDRARRQLAAWIKKDNQNGVSDG